MEPYVRNRIAGDNYMQKLKVAGKIDGARCRYGAFLLTSASLCMLHATAEQPPVGPERSCARIEFKKEKSNPIVRVKESLNFSSKIHKI